MRKKVLLILLLLILVGCSSDEEKQKTEYIAMKSELLAGNKYIESVEVPLDIVVNVDRINEDVYNYEVIFSNPSHNMYDIEAMVVHNYYDDELFPTLGLFDEKGELLVDSDTTIKLSDTIETNKDLSSIDLELKIYLKYVDENGEKKEIYYKTT